ncbi:MAG: alpha/beta hydrolase-fold protein [Pseudomonadota bacterium]
MHAKTRRAGLLPAVLILLLTACGGSSEQPGSDAVADKAATQHTVTITATVPADAPVVYLSGNLPELGPWHPERFEMSGTGAERTATLTVPAGHLLRYKITAGSWEREGLGPSGTVMPEFTAMIDSDKSLTAEIAGFRVDPEKLIADWEGSGVQGTLVYWKDMPSQFLDETRHVVTWLPPGYDADSDQTYRVIYTHDGQNLFDPRLSYTNVDWGIDEAMMRGVEEGAYEPAIVVGIWNTPARLYEYSPWHKAPEYARFILEELMPRVEAQFNVKTGPENTFVMGSSMGGLVSWYLLKEHSDVFGACGCVSSHLTWSEQMIEWFAGRDPSSADPTPYIVAEIQDGATMPDNVRMYFDYGTEELDAAYEAPHLAVREWLIAQGFTDGENLKMQKFEGDGHKESAWRERVGAHLEWMLAAP